MTFKDWLAIAWTLAVLAAYLRSLAEGIGA